MPAPDGVAFTIAMIRRKLNLAYSQALRPFGITTRQYGVLTRLWRAPSVGLSLDQLVIALYTDQSSLSRVVERMARDGLVVRRVDASDRRGRRISLTARSRALRRPLERCDRRLSRKLTRGLSAVEERRLSELLGRLLGNLS